MLEGDQHVTIDAAFDRSDLFLSINSMANARLYFTVSAGRKICSQNWDILTKDLENKTMRAILDGSGVLWMAIRNGGLFLLKSNAFVVSTSTERIFPNSSPIAFRSYETAQLFSKLDTSALLEIARLRDIPSGKLHLFDHFSPQSRADSQRGDFSTHRLRSCTREGARSR